MSQYEKDKCEFDKFFQMNCASLNFTQLGILKVISRSRIGLYNQLF